MNAPIYPSCAEAAAHGTGGCGRLASEPMAGIPGGAPLDHPPRAISPQPVEAARGARGAASTGEPIRDLLEACLRMLKLTGGSQYWTGDTQAALEFMETAVAAALEMGASETPRIGAASVVPEIIGSVAASVDCGLQMAGVEAERPRS